MSPVKGTNRSHHFGVCAGPRTFFYVKGMYQQEKHVCQMASFYFIRGGCGGSGQPFRVNSMDESSKGIKENVRLESPQSTLMAIHRLASISLMTSLRLHV